jgi:hypothetical protein
LKPIDRAEIHFLVQRLVPVISQHRQDRSEILCPLMPIHYDHTGDRGGDHGMDTIVQTDQPVPTIGKMKQLILAVASQTEAAN